MAKSRCGKRTLCCGLIGAAVALLTPRAAQAECKQEDKETEAAAFRQGLTKFRDGDTTGAVAIWQGLLKTLGTECGWKVLFNLGRAYEQLGSPTRAIESYQTFIRAADKQAELSDAELGIKRAAETSIAALKAKYGAISVPAPSSGVVWVRVGLSEPQPAGFTLYVAPGSHEIEIFSRTPKARIRTIQVAAGKVTTVAIPEASRVQTPIAPPSTVKTPPPSTPAGVRAFPTALVAIGSGLTLAAAGTSVFLYTRQSSKRVNAEAFSRTDPEYARLRDQHQDARTWYYGGLAVTGVFAAATTVVVLAHILAGDDAPAQVRATAGPGLANMWLSGKF